MIELTSQARKLEVIRNNAVCQCNLNLARPARVLSTLFLVALSLVIAPLEGVKGDDAKAVQVN